MIPQQPASRAGSVASEVVLGGRKVALRRPRVRADGHEMALPTFQVMAHVASVRPLAAIAGYDEYDRELAESDASHQAQRQVLAERKDDRAVGRGRHPRSCHGLSSLQRMCGYAEGRRRGASPRSGLVIAAENVA